MDYRELLKKYIKVILKEEDCDYFTSCYEINDEEMKELQSIAAEIEGAELESRNEY